MGDDAARAAAGVAENERIVAIVNVGEPAGRRRRGRGRRPRGADEMGWIGEALLYYFVPRTTP
jgi:hypothetical protein